MQRPSTPSTPEAKPSIPNTTPDGKLAAEPQPLLEPLDDVAEGGRTRYVSVGTEQLADEDLRYSNVACTD